MSKDETALESEIREKGLTAPRVTPEMLDAEIASEHYFTALDGVDGHFRGGPEAQGVSHASTLGCMTFCVLVLRNGFTVTGESACASPENFNWEIGKKIAKSNARDKIWPFLGFRLRDQIAGGSVV